MIFIVTVSILIRIHTDKGEDRITGNIFIANVLIRIMTGLVSEMVTKQG